MTVRVLFFGALGDALRCRETTLAVPAGTVAQVWELATAEHPAIGAAREHVRCARNLEYCDWQTPVMQGDEVAFMPPVSGGNGAEDSSSEVVALTAETIDVAGALAAAGSAADGAISCFVGQVRGRSDGLSVHRLDYQAYAPMALTTMRVIARDARARHGLSSVTLLHRTGELAVGEVAVLVITAAPHRAAALDGCREIIEAVKRDVPIWKREHTDGGAAWVDARCLEDVHA